MQDDWVGSSGWSDCVGSHGQESVYQCCSNDGVVTLYEDKSRGAGCDALDYSGNVVDANSADHCCQGEDYCCAPVGDTSSQTDGGHGGFTVVKAKSGTDCGEGVAAGRKVLVPSALAGTRCCGSIYDSFCNNDNDLCLNGAAPGYVTYEVATVSYTHLTLPTKA